MTLRHYVENGELTKYSEKKIDNPRREGNELA